MKLRSHQRASLFQKLLSVALSTFFLSQLLPSFLLAGRRDLPFPRRALHARCFHLWLLSLSPLTTLAVVFFDNGDATDLPWKSPPFIKLLSLTTVSFLSHTIYRSTAPRLPSLQQALRLGIPHLWLPLCFCPSQFSVSISP